MPADVFAAPSTAFFWNAFPVFLLMAAVTIATPGPGVIMTLTNTVRFGLRNSLGGILGLAAGIFCVATLSATSLGVLLASSAQAFTVVKYVGAAYLVYLGLRLWRAPVRSDAEIAAVTAPFHRRFAAGLALQLTNPQSILFFMSVFPQFIDPASPFVPQFVVLVCTFSTLLVLIHLAYATSARYAGGWLRRPGAGRWINRVSGSAFILFGVLLAGARR